MSERRQIPLVHLVAGFSASLAVFLVFLPVLYSSYGIYDAVRMLLDFGWTGESRLLGVMIGGGRFLYAYLAELGFSNILFMEDLWVLRLLGVMGLMTCAWTITAYACRNGWDILTAVCLSLVALVNPGAVVYGFWSACFPYGLGILAAFIAGILWEQERWGLRILSILLMQVAMAIYQPTALYFFLGPFIRWFGHRHEPARPYNVIWCTLAIILNMVVHIVLVRFILSAFPDIPGQGARLIEGGIPQALHHLVASVIPRTFAGWGDLLPPGISHGFILIFAAGWILFLVGTRGSGDRMARIISLLPVAFTFIPAFVSADGYTPYRLLAPAYCAIGIIAFTGFAHSFKGRYALRSLFVGIFGLALLLAGSFSVQFGVVRPRTMELSIIREAIAETSPEEAMDGMFIIRPSGTFPVDRLIKQKAEYGAYELTYGGFSEAYMSLIAARQYGWTPAEGNPINRVHWVFFNAETEVVPPFYPVLDIRVRLQGMEVSPPAVAQGAAVQHPYLGNALFFSPSLYMSPGLGLTQQEADRWFFMPGHGWMQWISEPGKLPLEARNTAGEIVRFEKP